MAVIHIPDRAVLGVDPGEKSGAAIVLTTRSGFAQGLVLARSVRDKAVERDEVVAAAVTSAKAAGVPLVVVLEKAAPGMGKRFGARTRDGFAQRCGQWLDAFERAGVPRARIVRVMPQQWRAPVLGVGGGKSEFMKELARSYALARYPELRTQADLSPDAFEAVCIALWGATYQAREEAAAKAAAKAAKAAAKAAGGAA